MSEQKQRQFVDGLWIKEKVFDSGGAILKIGVLMDSLVKSLNKIKKNEKGFADLVISRRREVGKNGETHTCYVDDWKPSVKSEVPAKPAVEKSAKTAEPEEELI